MCTVKPLMLACPIFRQPGAVFYTGSTASNAEIMAEKYHSLVLFA